MPKVSLRKTYGQTLLDLGRKDKNIVVMDADLAKSTQTIVFGKEIAERFIDVGLSEQDMISMAAGLSLTGKTVFASSFCVFLVGRVYDQVRQSVCYNNANVKLIGTHSGLGVGEDGSTHQSLEDIALMRPLPNINIIVPADAIETARVIEYVSHHHGPYFVRLTRSNLDQIYDENYSFELGKASILRKGQDISVFAIGAMVEKALEAAELLEKESISTAVINMSTLKPLDKQTILDMARTTRAVISIEDHSVYGGLGSAIAECLSQNHPTKMKIMGIDNKFGRSGSPDELYTHYGLSAKNIVTEAKNILK
jgi:transketolase